MNSTRDGAAGSTLYPPLPVWKVFLLLLFTLSFYQFVWFYRTARDMRDGDGARFQPWLWILAPWVGLIAAIATYRLAARMRRWANRAGAVKHTLAAPAVVAGLVFAANTIATAAGSWESSLIVLAGSLIIWGLPVLVMQAQINEIKGRLAPERFRDRPGHYTRKQLATCVIGGFLIAVVGVLAILDHAARSADGLEAESRIDDSNGRFTLTVPDAGWSRVATDYLSEDGELSLMGPNDASWAIVYFYPAFTVDEALDFRLDEFTAGEPAIECAESKTLDEASMHVVGKLTCSGRSVLEGRYAYHVRVVSDGQKLAEILVYAGAEDRDMFEQRLQAGKRLADGLGLAE